MQKKYKESLSIEAKAEVLKYVKIMGGMKQAAISLDITPGLIYAWFEGRSKIKEQHARLIEKNSNGLCHYSVILSSRRSLRNIQHICLKDFIFDEILEGKAKLLSLTAQEYYEQFVPDKIKTVVEKADFSTKDCQVLSVFFGAEPEYWLTVVNSF